MPDLAQILTQSTPQLYALGGVKDAAKVQTWSNTPNFAFAFKDFTPIATASDAIIIQGSAGKTAKIQAICITGESTAAGAMAIQLIRRSSVGTLGSAILTAITGYANDLMDGSPATIVSTVGTANITSLGTQTGFYGAQQLIFNNNGAVGSNPVIWNFETMGIKPIFLRGASDYLMINMAGDTVPTGGKLYVEIRIDEDNS